MRSKPLLNPKRFLIIQTAFLGDVVLATPLIEKLRHYYPNAPIDFLLRKGNESLLEAHPFLNQLYIFDKKNKRSEMKRLIKIFRQNQYDHIINLHRFWSSGWMALRAKPKEVIGFDKHPLSFFFSKKIKHKIGDPDHPLHEIERNLLLIEHLTDQRIFPPALYPTKRHFKEIPKVKNYVCIAPTSVWFTKQWPKEKWIKLIQQLDKNLSIFLLGAPSDFEACEVIKLKSGHLKTFNLAGKLSILASATLMRNAQMNFVNDSAPMHMASAMNAPVTAVYCSTVPIFGFRPLSDQSFIIQSEEALDCRPCGLHGKASCPKGHFKCADISTEKILTHIKKSIEL